MEEFDVIVVGAGIEGSATAYSLAKGNIKTLLLEQVRQPCMTRHLNRKKTGPKKHTVLLSQ